MHIEIHDRFSARFYVGVRLCTECIVLQLVMLALQSFVNLRSGKLEFSRYKWNSHNVSDHISRNTDFWKTWLYFLRTLVHPELSIALLLSVFPSYGLKFYYSTDYLLSWPRQQYRPIFRCGPIFFINHSLSAESIHFIPCPLVSCLS